MLHKIIIIATVFLGTIPGQTVGSGIEAVRIGMTLEAVNAALNRSDVAKIVDTRDRSIVIWTFTGSGGMNNTITFKNGRVVEVDAHTSSYTGDAREAVKKLYALLYGLTKPGLTNERTAAATILLREYPNVAGGSRFGT